jgi:hypothetical protein
LFFDAENNQHKKKLKPNKANMQIRTKDGKLSACIDMQKLDEKYTDEKLDFAEIIAE